MLSSSGRVALLDRPLHRNAPMTPRASSTLRGTAMVEDPFNDEDATCRSLYSILGSTVDSDKPVTTEEMLQHIVYDADNPNLIAGSLSGAFENARRSREFISSEMWVALNSTRNRTAPDGEHRASRLGPFRSICCRA